MDPYVIYGHLESGDQISIPLSLILSTAVNLFYVFVTWVPFLLLVVSVVNGFIFSPTRVGWWTIILIDDSIFSIVEWQLFGFSREIRIISDEFWVFQTLEGLISISRDNQKTWFRNWSLFQKGWVNTPFRLKHVYFN